MKSSKKAARFKLLQEIREAGWQIKRQEGDHYIVVHPIYGQSRFAIPSPTDTGAWSEISKRLHLKEGKERMAQFRTKQKSRMPEVGSYGYELYTSRAGRRLAVQDLAKLAGVSSSTIMGAEANETIPHEDTQKRLAQIFDNPRLVVIKSASQQIEDRGSYRITDTVPVAVNAHDQITPSPEQVAVPPSALPVATAREKREYNRKPREIKRGRKPGRKPMQRAVALTEVTDYISHDQFNDAMLTIRTYITQLEKAAKNWNALKELVKDE